MQYLGDFAEDQTVYMPFNTFSSNDPQASVTATTLADTDIYVHKDGSITNLVTDGASVVIDYDGIAGNHLLTIDTSASADYAIGSDYMVRIEGMTVDAGLVNAIIGSFSIENRYNAAADDLANATDGLGALKALIDTLTTNLATVDTVADGIQTDLSNATDGLGAIKTSVDAIPTTAMRGTDSAATSAALATAQLDLDIITDTDGVVLGAAGVDLIWDEQLTGGTHNVATSGGRRLRGLQEFQGYEGGAVWIDITNGATGTTDYEFGTAENPTNTLAQALTIATSVGMSRFEVAPASLLTFTSTLNNKIFRGDGWTLALGGQDITDTHIHGAHAISGVATSTGVSMFENCIFNAVTLPAAGYVHESALKGVVTLGAIGAYHFHGCFADSDTGSTIDFTLALGAQTAYIHDWDGKITFKNMQAGDNVHISGAGQIIVDVSCTGGQIHDQGFYRYTDNASGAVTRLQSDITDDMDAIKAETALIVADTNELQVDDVPTLIANLDAVVDTVKVDTAAILVDTGTTIPATITTIDNEIATIDTNVDAILVDTGTTLDAAIAVIDANVDQLELGIIFGAAAAGTLSTTVSTSDLTGYADDQLIGRVIIWTSGACDGEATDITDYASTGGTLTFTALTTAPSAADTFKIV